MTHIEKIAAKRRQAAMIHRINAPLFKSTRPVASFAGCAWVSQLARDLSEGAV